MADIQQFMLVFEQKDLVECNAWDYQYHDYFMVPLCIMYFDDIGPCMYFINEYDTNQPGRKLIHKYIAELDDDHLHMRVHFEIKKWIDPESFMITMDNLERCKKTINLFDEVIDTLKDVGQIPESFNFRFDGTVGSGNYYRGEKHKDDDDE